MFKGEYIDDEILEEGREFIHFIDMFINIVHPKHAFLHHLPFQGSYLDQGSITMMIMKILRTEWIEKLKDDEEKMKKH
jgi:hypothetical protein